MKRTFETRKLYFGFPVFFLGYKDDVHGYNISTSSSVYSLGSMMVIAMRTKGNAITEITKHQQFTVNVLGRPGLARPAPIPQFSRPHTGAVRLHQRRG